MPPSGDLKGVKATGYNLKCAKCLAVILVYTYQTYVTIINLILKKIIKGEAFYMDKETNQES